MHMHTNAHNKVVDYLFTLPVELDCYFVTQSLSDVLGDGCAPFTCVCLRLQRHAKLDIGRNAYGGEHLSSRDYIKLHH